MSESALGSSASGLLGRAAALPFLADEKTRGKRDVSSCRRAKPMTGLSSRATERKRSWSSPPVRLHHPHDGAYDTVVAAAATQIAGERPANLGFGRLRIALEQVGRRNDHAAGAIAAMRGLLVDEGLLQWMQLVEGAEPLQRGDLVGTEVRDRHHAGAHDRAVDEHRAGAALREPAAELCAVKLEIIAQHIEQRGVRLGLHRAGRPVDLQADGHARLLSLLNRSILERE